ncbi:MAG: ATP-binding protein [Myxococcota bacterium]|jgi:hypothetical protein|nr:ATP-binding protein [Myxococcota bacterium]
MSDDTASSEERSSESRGRRLSLALSSLYLDPNNYRFIDHPDYRQVDEERVGGEEVQRRTRRFLLGQNAEHVADLMVSFTQNGWLDVEPIHVRRLTERAFLVVEGNRRVATLMHLKARWQESTGQLGKLNPKLFSQVPCILYEETDAFQQLVVMGLHHISGKRRWPAINQARLMKRLRDEHQRDPDQLCHALGVSRREFNLSLRTLALSESYRQSDYGDQFSSDMFNLFREVLKAPSLRAWLGWEPDTERATNAANLERLFSWLSREAEDESADSPNEERAARSGEAVITTGVQIRELAKLIEDPEAVKRLEETRSLQAATLSSGMLVRNEIEGALERCRLDVDRLFQLSTRLSSTELDRVDQLTARMDAIAVARQRQPPSRGSERPWQVYTEVPQAQFHEVYAERYRAITGVRFEQLGRVNLLVGVNNAGKTSVLEMLFLLANQSDPRAILEVLRRRTRLDPSSHPAWVVNQVPTELLIRGSFDKRDNAVSVAMKLVDSPEDSDEDLASYLRTLVITSNYVGRRQRSVTDFFEGRTRRTRVEGEARWLCPAVLHSPFSLSDPETLTRCNEASIRGKSKERVLTFIREHLDPGIEDIALANEHKRFLVTHTELPEAVDLSLFGEGLQRVFQIGLLFAGVRGGVLLIDEFENAIHTTVLLQFTKLVQELAVEFDVQVFVTTHSKETVDAFLFNGFRTEELAAYLLKRGEGGVVGVQRFGGPELKRAVEVGDVDLRRL